jgi:hypothetical protein
MASHLPRAHLLADHLGARELCLHGDGCSVKGDRDATYSARFRGPESFRFGVDRVVISIIFMVNVQWLLAVLG